MSKTTAEFLTGVKRRITMPANQVLMEDDDILDIGSVILRLTMTKILKSAQQNYLLTTIDIPLVADQAGYDVPYRAVVGGLEDIKFLYSDGITLKSLSYITVEDINQYTSTATYPQAFYFQSDQIIIVPKPISAAGSLRLPYHRKLSSLCLTTDAAQVTAKTATTVTVSSAPTGILAGSTVDFIKEKSLSTILSQDIVISSIASTTYTFSAGVIPSRLVVGDWVSVNGTTPILPIPDECYDYFEALTGVSILKAIGDEEGARSLKAEVTGLEKEVITLLQPRIDGEPEKIISYHGLLRSKSFRYFGRG